MTGRLAGKIALITGAAQGLGEATARMFVAQGARVALTDLNADKVMAVADSLNASHPGSARAWAQDVTSEAQWQTVTAEAASHFGGLHVLVNNAGIGSLGTVEQETLERWQKVFAVDVDSIFLGCKYAMPLMRASGRMGSIVNISSIAGIVAASNYAAYNAAKAAVLHLSKSVALHGARGTPQIRSNSVHPAFVRTPILEGIAGSAPLADVHAKLARQIPLGRLGEPEEVAYLVTYLASDESSFVTGAEFKIDGGISAQ
jgi:NAD(P)-dependent dehydrogenase (short-subunit alcohol dehydrogenase family)